MTTVLREHTVTTQANPRASKAALRKEIEQLRRAGQQMSNALYNLGQETSRAPDARDKESMRRAVSEWDSIKRAE
jgi:hypothetical protein